MISFIVAFDRDRVIGKNNRLPWHLPNDLARFKRITTGHTVVMGRKTYESIGRPLPNRRNVILTRNKSFEAEGCEVVHTYEEVINRCRDEKCFIIGGSELFSLFWEDAERLYVTFIDASFDGDTFFPPIDERDWQLVSVEEGNVDEKNKYRHEFRLYVRKTTP